LSDPFKTRWIELCDLEALTREMFSALDTP